jgi:hypothetical protein
LILISSIFAKWGKSTIIWAFFAPSGEHNSFYALKFERTVSKQDYKRQSSIALLVQFAIHGGWYVPGDL